MPIEPTETRTVGSFERETDLRKAGDVKWIIQQQSRKAAEVTKAARDLCTHAIN